MIQKCTKNDTLWFNKAQNPLLHPNLDSKVLAAMLCACHKNLHKVLIWTSCELWCFYIFIFVRLEAGTCKVWNVIILWLFELYVHVFVQHVAFCFLKKLCEHMFMWSQRENKEGGRGSWFKSTFRAWKDKLVQGAKMCLEFIHFASQIFLKFQLWNSKLQMVVVVLMLCFCLVQLPLAIMVVSKHDTRVHKRCSNYLIFDDFEW